MRRLAFGQPLGLTPSVPVPAGPYTVYYRLIIILLLFLVSSKSNEVFDCEPIHLNSASEQQQQQQQRLLFYSPASRILPIRRT
jgi:hypothetical protein